MSATMSAKELHDLRSAKIALPIEQRRHNKARRRIHELERLVHAIAVQNDPVWARQLARDHLGLGPMPDSSIWQRIRHWIRRAA